MRTSRRLQTEWVRKLTENHCGDDSIDKIVTDPGKKGRGGAESIELDQPGTLPKVQPICLCYSTDNLRSAVANGLAPEVH